VPLVFSILSPRDTLGTRKGTNSQRYFGAFLVAEVTA